MKAKKLIPIFALMLGLSSFASCTPGDQAIELAPYWHKGAKAAYVELKEELTYVVTFEKGSGLESVGYDLNYLNGKYTTKLEQKSDYTYEYTTTFSIDVIYTLDGQDPVTKTDSVTSKVRFDATTDNLKPISSEKTIICHSPLLVTDPETVEDCYFGGKALQYSVVTNYEEDGSKGTAVKTNLETKEVEELSIKKSGKLSFFDNEQIPFVLRALSTDVTTAKIKTYSAFAEATQTIAISFSKEAESAHTFETLTVNGEAKTNESFAYREATMKIDAKNSGVTQTLYIATQEQDRNIILQMQTPLSYSLGTLTYSLTSITRSEKQ